MCSFGSCQMLFEILSQFRKVRNAFDCFVTQVQTHLPKTKRVWPMKINMIEGHKEGVLFTVHEENKSPITVHKDNKHIYSTRVSNHETCV